TSSGADTGLLAQAVVAAFGIGTSIAAIDGLILPVHPYLSQLERCVVALRRIRARNQLDLRRRALRNADLAVDHDVAGYVPVKGLSKLLPLERDVLIQRYRHAGPRRDVYRRAGRGTRDTRTQ